MNDIPTKAKMTVKKEATGKVTFMLNSNICSRSTIKKTFKHFCFQNWILNIFLTGK